MNPLTGLKMQYIVDKWPDWKLLLLKAGHYPGQVGKHIPAYPRF